MTQSRLKSIPRTNLLEGKLILVTGVGYKPVLRKFYNPGLKEYSHDSILVDGEEMKLNMGAAAAFIFAANGADVVLVSRNRDNLHIVKDNIESLLELPKENRKDYTERISCIPGDLLDSCFVKALVEALPKKKRIYWFSSIGLGAGSYKLKDDNPYLHLEDIPIELLEQESRTVLRGTHLLMQRLLPVFRDQDDSRIAIVSSMSAIRGYSRGGAHCAAKGAISRYANSAMLDLWKNRIYVTDIRPGIIDTGMYDGSAVQKAVDEIAKEYSGSFSKDYCLAPPVSVGYAALLAFTSPAHITSINLVAQGQFPNEGS